MKTRIIPAMLMVALVVSLSGCPPTPQVSLGVWLFTLNGNSVAGIDLGTDGMTQIPNPFPSEASTLFLGSPTWTQDGAVFTMTLKISGTVTVYTGTVDSSTSIIDGTWIKTVGGTASGTWSGMKL